MGFVTRAFGGGGGGREAAEQERQLQQQRLQEAQDQQRRTAQLMSEERAKADKVASAQRRLRLGGGRGLLRFSEPSADVLLGNTTL